MSFPSLVPSRWAFSIALLSLIVSGCVHIAGAESVLVKSKEKIDTRLVMINSANAKVELERFGDLRKNHEQDEKAAFNQCGYDPGQELAPLAAGLLSTVAGYVVGETVDFLMNKVEGILADEVKKYALAYDAQSRFDFYDGPAGQEAGYPDLQFQCFRLTRRKDNEVLFDMIGGFSIQNNEYLEVFPLRTYFAGSTVKSVDKEGTRSYGVTVKLKASSIWREHNRGKLANDAMAVSLLKETFLLPEKSGNAYVYKTYFDNTDVVTIVPLLPWSTYGDIAYGGNQTLLTVSVAEMGEAPWLLEQAKDLFSGVKDDVSKQIKDAADTLIKEKLPVPAE